MNTKYMFTVAAMAVMLIGATALATEDADHYIAYLYLFPSSYPLE